MTPVVPIEANRCPICGSRNTLTDYERIYTDRAYRDWHCPDCGARGTAVYNVVFINHENLKDRNDIDHKVYGENDDGGERP